MNIGKKLLCGTITLCLLGQSLSGIPAVSAKTNAVKLNVSKKTITVGKSFSLKLKGNVSSKAVVTWKSSNKKIAVVSKNGRVTGKKAGKAKITVTVSGKKGKAVCKDADSCFCITGTGITNEYTVCNRYAGSVCVTVAVIKDCRSISIGGLSESRGTRWGCHDSLSY